MSTQQESSHGLLRACDITKTFDQSPVLQGVSLKIDPAETVAIMGPSGSGKSTLLHCLSGVLLPSSGQVYFQNQCLNTLSDGQRSALRLEKLAFVFQDGQLLPELNARDNVALPAVLRGVPKDQALAAAEDMLERVGLAQHAGKRPGQLSGGEAQRVAVARAMAGRPLIIFADEPTGALDQASGHEVMQQLVSLCQQLGAALITVTHDRNIAGWCSRIIEIRDGLIFKDLKQ